MYFYIDPEVEKSSESIPGGEVFFLDEVDAEEALGCDANNVPPGSGWYWWPCFPGCMPDGEMDGPYPTQEDAIKAARNS